MRILFKILLLLLSFQSFANCDFKKNIKKVISLSGSSTVVLKELGLLKKTNVKGISVFNPITEADFAGKVYPGGIFLSHQALNELDGSVVFYDESRELHRIFTSHPKVMSREIKTRNLLPKEAHQATMTILKEFVEGCESEFKKLDKKISDLQNEIFKFIPANQTMIFYLGDFLGGRRPEMMMVNDGVVKLLVKEKKIATYPSHLAYVNWSSKILNTLPATTLHIAIKDTGRNGKREIKKSPMGMTLVYPGALIPGLSQLEACLYLFKSL
jgi:hypothetical protein